jgi:ferric-dicitrate binding protein FerR (iron transport regulator)
MRHGLTATLIQGRIEYQASARAVGGLLSDMPVPARRGSLCQGVDEEEDHREAEGQAAAILTVAEATAAGIRKIAEALQVPGGPQTVQLRVAEQYIAQFGQLAKVGTTMIVPAPLSDVSAMLATAMSVMRQSEPPLLPSGQA